MKLTPILTGTVGVAAVEAVEKINAAMVESVTNSPEIVQAATTDITTTPALVQVVVQLLIGLVTLYKMLKPSKKD